MLGVIDSSAVQEMEARGANNLANQTAIYDMKKAALGAALGWPAGQLPAGGTIADLTMKGMIGDAPTLESVQSNAPTTAVADATNQTNYYIAEDLRAQRSQPRRNGPVRPSRRVTEEARGDSGGPTA